MLSNVNEEKINNSFLLRLNDKKIAYPILVYDTNFNLRFKNMLFMSLFHDQNDILKKLKDKLKEKLENKKVFLDYENKRYDLILINLGIEYMVILDDMTKEVEALSKIKETVVNLEREKSLFIDLLSKLPFGIVLIDSEHTILYNNAKALSLFHFPQRAKLDKCYLLYKEFKPCKDCKIQKLIETSKNKKLRDHTPIKETTEIEPNYYITSTHYALNDNRFLIIYEETSREVTLLNKIKEQQHKLEKQNNILHSLYTVSLDVTSKNDLDNILGIICQSLPGIFNLTKIGIVLHNERYNVTNAVFNNIEENIQKQLIDKDVLSGKIELSDEYTYIIFKSNEGKDVGRIYILKSEKSNLEGEVIPIFTKQIVSLVSNKILQKKLEEAAHIDGLTKLFNRYYFDKVFAEEVEKAEKFNYPLAVIMIDINGLKELNDTVGHQAGDELLIASSELLRNNLRQTDYIFRYGGDEIIVLIVNCNMQDLETIINKLKEIQKDAYFEFNNNKYNIRFSLGGVTTEEYKISELIVKADERMYKDKMEYYKTHKKYR